MAAILASECSYCRSGDFVNHRRTANNISFSVSISVYSFSNYKKRFRKYKVNMQQTESPPELGTNGRPIKMVPASTITKRKAQSTNNEEKMNGSKQVINGTRVPTSEITKRKVTATNAKIANGSNQVINGAAVVNGISLIKRDPAPGQLKSPRSEELPPIEDLKILPSDEGFSWANENYSSFQRSIDVWSFVLSLRLRVLLDNSKWTYIGGYTEDKQKNRRRRTASWLRECVLQLGPTFIKLGQLSSTRSDLFPKEFVEELAKLQDRVPAFSPEKAKDFIEKELGAPVDMLFKEFEDRPIAAASLGQVFASF